MPETWIVDPSILAATIRHAIVIRFGCGKGGIVSLQSPSPSPRLGELPQPPGHPNPQDDLSFSISKDFVEYHLDKFSSVLGPTSPSPDSGVLVFIVPLC